MGPPSANGGPQCKSRKRCIETWGEVIGRHGEETKNDNGQRLLRLCIMNELIILNTFYYHKDIHKLTWESKGRGLMQVYYKLFHHQEGAEARSG